MPPQTPFVLVDNRFDRINLYPNTSLSSSAAMVGREVQYVADYRRERTFYQAAGVAAGQFVRVDSGVGNTIVFDTVFIDRGHNLWNASIAIEASDDNFTTTPYGVTRIAPAQGTLGGDPTANWCVTEEGALYTFVPVNFPRRYGQVRVVTSMAPIVTGVILGQRIQLARYSNTADDDAGERSNRSEQSLLPGYSGDDRSYSARRTTLDLSLIDATEYDSKIRVLRRLLFDVNQCAFVSMDYGTNPERAWLYKYQGNQWSSPRTRTYRKVTIPLYEYGPAVR